MNLLKDTSDDANFQKYLNQTIAYPMDKAEKCKYYVQTQMKSKTKAGFYSGNQD